MPADANLRHRATRDCPHHHIFPAAPSCPAVGLAARRIDAPAERRGPQPERRVRLLPSAPWDPCGGAGAPCALGLTSAASRAAAAEGPTSGLILSQLGQLNSGCCGYVLPGQPHGSPLHRGRIAVHPSPSPPISFSAFLRPSCAHLPQLRRRRKAAALKRQADVYAKEVFE